MLNKNQYALITGGASGMGFELARLFAKDGYNRVTNLTEAFLGIPLQATTAEIAKYVLLWHLKMQHLQLPQNL